MAAQLPLRDVHLPAAPGWWPPAPGWLLLFAALVLALAAVAIFFWLRRRRRQRWLALFDQQLVSAGPGAARLAAASELLRRAARRTDPRAVQLQGEAWLHFLDGSKGSDFSGGEGRLLLDGGFRPMVDADEVAAACAVARTRFLALMEGKR